MYDKERHSRLRKVGRDEVSKMIDEGKIALGPQGAIAFFLAYQVQDLVEADRDGVDSHERIYEEAYHSAVKSCLQMALGLESEPLVREINDRLHDAMVQEIEKLKQEAEA